MTILTISDGMNNGKGDESIIVLCNQCYIYDININEKEEIFINNNIFKFNNIKIVIFNYDEDSNCFNRTPLLINKFKTFQNMINLFIKISKIILKQNQDIIFYNDPSICIHLSSKLDTYNMINHINNDNIKIPPYIEIQNITDLNKVNFYPCIIS